MTKPWFAIGWEVGVLSGWGQFGAHFARTLHSAGYPVTILGALNPSGVTPMDRPLLQSLVGPLPDSPGWLCMAIGNGLEERPEGLQANVKVAGIIFCEDVGVLTPEGVAKLNAYDVIVAGSRWTERVLRERGVERVVLAHQGYDSRVFAPLLSPPVAENAGKYRDAHDTKAPLVFSGGKLEFRKGQDIVIEAFKRFRQTPEGKDAVLVVAWDNQWPQTMDGIWLSGYVKGVPSVKAGRLDLVPWLAMNGIPAEAVIDCGRLTPTELAHVLRSCTVGVFPNRAESGTNMLLVEALASGLPCIAAPVHGHKDVTGGLPVASHDPVPSGCRLYASTEGWWEYDVEAIVSALQLGYSAQEWRGAAYWSWDVRGPAMAEAIIQSALPWTTAEATFGGRNP